MVNTVMTSNKKVCSIVYVGLKTGFMFILGKFHPEKADAAYDITPELRKLCTKFKQQLGDNVYSDSAIDSMAKAFLKKHGWKVAFSDYDERCFADDVIDSTDILDDDDMLSESMTTDDVKKFLKLARTGEVKFKFKEVKDNSVRTALGTLKKDVIKKELSDVKKAKRRHRVPNSIIVYWDLDKNSWRSFRKANFIKFIN